VILDRRAPSRSPDASGGAGTRLREAPQPQPEHAESPHPDPGLTDLSGRDYVAIFRRSVREARDDHLTNFAAALAYYAFLAIPSLLLIALGVFGLVASPADVRSAIDRLGSVIPPEARTLLLDSLLRTTERAGTGVTMIALGVVLALWSLGGAMQNLMWALNVVYERDETRGFVRRRLTAAAMVVFALAGIGLLLGVLVLGPHLSVWVGDAVGETTLVRTLWWVAEWPLLVLALLVCFASLLLLGPNIEHPRWRFLTLGAVVAVAIWLLASGLFAYYSSKFGSYNKTWGALSGVVVMLTWLWLSALALLLGAEVDSEAERSRELRRGEPAEVQLQAPTKA
jgi:membrane protein